MTGVQTCALPISADIRGDYHYSLSRIWDEARPMITFVLLNPSTADAQRLDPTLRRCVSFAKREGYGGMVILNLYAFRTKSPKLMKAAVDPVGPENDLVLAGATGTVVAGWGNSADPERVTQAVALLPPLRALGINEGGQPTHPLYVLGDTPLIEWLP